MGQVLGGDQGSEREVCARCAVLHAVHMYRAQYRDLHTPRVSQSEIGDHSDNFSSTSSLRIWIAEIIESKLGEQLFFKMKTLF